VQMDELLRRARRIEDDADRQRFFDGVCERLRDLDPPIHDGDVRRAAVDAYKPFNPALAMRARQTKTVRMPRGVRANGSGSVVSSSSLTGPLLLLTVKGTRRCVGFVSGSIKIVATDLSNARMVRRTSSFIVLPSTIRR